MNRPSRQRGAFLIEALIAILIFSLGVLGMVAMGSSAISAQSDAKFRGDAAAFASDLASRIALNADPKGAVALADYVHQPNTDGHCQFSGPPSANQTVLDWIDRVRGANPYVIGLAGATSTSQQIVIDPTHYNSVVITVCWLPPSTSAAFNGNPHSYSLISYVPGAK